jgi:hypothetical protein
MITSLNAMKIDFFDIDKLNFVEFNITGDDMNYVKLNHESQYLNGNVFNLFVRCFEKSNELYEYFEPTKYNSRKIVILRNELVKNLQVLKKITSREAFNTYTEGLFLGAKFVNELNTIDPGWRDNWSGYLEQLVQLNQNMILLVDRCIDESRVLWLIGY